MVGTRPNFVKEYLVNLELRNRGIREVLIHTGQHFDYEMSQVFFECFDLPAPDHHLQITNTDNVTHTVTSDDGSSFNVTVPGGKTATFTAPAAGTYKFHCNIHSSMHGTLTVT